MGRPNPPIVTGAEKETVSSDPSPNAGRLLKVAPHLLGILLLAIGVFLVYSLIAIWPAVQQTTRGGTGTNTSSNSEAGSQVTTTTANPNSDRTTTAIAANDETRQIALFGSVVTLTPDTALLLLVVVTGALGSYVHAATSFATFVGNRKFTITWMWWYLLRLFIGVVLALLFYLAVRGGVLSAQAQSGAVNPYGIAALAALVGLFSKQATDKLREVFESLFRTQQGYGDDERADKIESAVPILLAIQPQQVPKGQAAQLRLDGRGFTRHSTVEIARVVHPSSRIMAEWDIIAETQIVVRIDAHFIDAPGQLSITVVNPELGGGSSLPVHVQVVDTALTNSLATRKRFQLRARGKR
jgi:hypothetical protein